MTVCRVRRVYDKLMFIQLKTAHGKKEERNRNLHNGDEKSVEKRSIFFLKNEKQIPFATVRQFSFRA